MLSLLSCRPSSIHIDEQTSSLSPAAGPRPLILQEHHADLTHVRLMDRFSTPLVHDAMHSPP